MKKYTNIPACILMLFLFNNCGKDSPPGNLQSEFKLISTSVDGVTSRTIKNGVDRMPAIKFNFSAPVSHDIAPGDISFKSSTGAGISYAIGFSNADSIIEINPSQPLSGLTKYYVSVSQNIKSIKGEKLGRKEELNFTTGIDTTMKFPSIPETELLTLVQSKTFRYFWDFAHPVSGMIRERDQSGDLVTTGGTGMGIMVLITGIERQFISRADGLNRIGKIVDFLQHKAQHYHGAFAHWMDGNTGNTIPFSPNDNGADLVETAYLMQGLLCARQYFNGNDAGELNLRQHIDELWKGVEWDWFRKDQENALYWHWSPDKDWIMNIKVTGWNEALITYVLAASSPTHTIPLEVYREGWAKNGAIRNGQIYFGYTLPLGPTLGGPLFFEHYSFLGIDPQGLSDTYGNYEDQTKNHALINQAYCSENPKGYYGYSASCWGLTACDLPNGGYDACSPTNDKGVIAPTAAVASLPFTPAESMNALRFFYYTLGDRLWGDYGFRDAFSLHEPWFADSYLAIDQAPQVIMIENYRSGLLWQLFMNCPEIKNGMKKLGFQSPYF